jgi:DNA polymerase elongation subunit (family B)
MNVFLTYTYFHNRRYTENETEWLNNNNKFIGPIEKIGVHDVYDDSETESDDDSDRETGYTNATRISFEKKVSTDRRFVVTIFGRNENGKSVAVHVHDYHPCFYVKVPYYFAKKFPDQINNFMLKLAKQASSILNKKHHRNNIKLIHEIKLVKKIDCKGFRNGIKENFMKFSFNNSITRTQYIYAIKRIVMDDKYNIRPIWKKPILNNIDRKYKFSIYDLKDDHSCKFFQDSNGVIKPTGWFKLDLTKSKKVVKKTTCDYEFSIKYSDLIKGGRTDFDGKPVLTSFAWDIETYAKETIKYRIGERIKYLFKETKKNYEIEIGKKISAKEYKEIFAKKLNGDLKSDMNTFIKNLNIKPDFKFKDIIFSIGISILKSPLGLIDLKNTKEQGIHLKNIVLTLNKYDEEKLKILNKKEEFLNLEIIECKNEKEIITKFIEIFRETCPDYAYTYNGDGYDWEWLRERSIAHDIEKRYFARMSKMISMKSKYRHIKTYSNQKGHRESQHMDTIGCLHVDLCKYFVNMNLSKHKRFTLKYMCNMYLKQIPEIRKRDMDYDVMREYMRLSYINPNGATEKGYILDIAYYNAFDCITLLFLADKCGILLNIMESSKINGLSSYKNHTSGNSIKVLSKFSEIAHRQGYLVCGDLVSDRDYFEYILNKFPNIRKKYDLTEPEKKEEFSIEIIKTLRAKGGKVQKYQDGYMENVCCIDVTSMYPSVIIDRGYDLTTKVRYDDPLCRECSNLENIKYVESEWNLSDNSITTAKYAKIGIKKSIIPLALEELLTWRKGTKRKMKERVKMWLENGTITDGVEAKDKSEWKMLNALQMQIKVCCNSFYGVLLSRKSCLYDPDLGGSITQKGREYITATTYIARDIFGMKVVYGDTDSIFTIVPELVPGITRKNPDYDPNKKSIQNINPKEIPLTKKEIYTMTWKKNERLSNTINGLMAKFGATRMNIEVEKIFTKFFSFTKKKYAGIKCENPTDPNDSQLVLAGLDSIKRSASKIETYMGEKIVELLLQNKPDEIIKFLETLSEEIYIKKSIPDDWFTKTIVFNGFENYANRNIIQCALARKVIECDPGNLVVAGDRIIYTYILLPGTRTFGKRGGLVELARSKTAFPFQYIGNIEGAEIDYALFIIAGIGMFSDLLISLIDGVNNKRELKLYVYEIIKKYHNIFK